MAIPKEPRNPGFSLIRLSIVVYGLVLAFTALAVVAWYVYRPPEQISGMIYIPAGTFLSGSENHPVKLGAFYIDATEVTNADFTDFCRAQNCAIPSGAPNLPVVNISIPLARAFAHWKQKRLPTPLEWERAARGINGVPYPWGEAANPMLANVSDNASLKQHALMPVRSLGSYPAFQMLGNAAEMVDGEANPTQQDVTKFARLLTPPLKEDDPWIEVRGGSYLEPLRPVYEVRLVPARYTAMDIGFRCAKDR